MNIPLLRVVALNHQLPIARIHKHTGNLQSIARAEEPGIHEYSRLTPFEKGDAEGGRFLRPARLTNAPGKSLRN